MRNDMTTHTITAGTFAAPAIWAATIWAAPLAAQAGETTWIGPATGQAWTTATAWSAGVPGIGDTAVFGSVSAAMRVSLGSTALLIDRLRLARGTLTLTGSASLDMDDANAFTPSMALGTDAAVPSQFRWHSTGVLRPARLDIGLGASSAASLLLYAGSLEVPQGARVGVVGAGSLSLQRAAWFQSLELGTSASGNGLLAGGSSLSPSFAIVVDGRLTVGKFGEGQAILGGPDELGSITLGLNTGSHGTVEAHDLHVWGDASIGHGGVGSLTITGQARVDGPVAIAVLGESLVPPYVLPAEGTLIIDGGALSCGGPMWAGAGAADVRVWDGSLESTNSLSITNAASTLVTTLPAIPRSGPTLAAPVVTSSQWSVTVEGTPEPTAVWHLRHAWNTPSPLAVPTSVTGSPGTGRDWRLIECSGDLYLASAPIGAPDPDVCTATTPSIEVLDPDAAEARSFGTGGVAAGDGWYAVGCPGGDGSVDVYSRVGGAWTRLTRLNGTPTAIIGAAVAASGQRLATLTTDGATAMVYVRNAGAWQLEATLPVATSTGAAAVAYALALDGDVLAVGLPNLDGERGGLELFRRKGSTWMAEQRIEVPTNASTSTRFGQRVAVSGDQLAATGNRIGTSTTIELWEHADGAWSNVGYVFASQTTPFDFDAGTLACTNLSTVELWAQAADNTWRTVAIGPPNTASGEKALAIGAGRLSIGSPTAVWALDERTPQEWRMGSSVPLPAPVTDLSTAGALVVGVGATASWVVQTDEAQSCAGDFDSDGAVGGSDLGMLLVWWETSPLGDLNADGVTNGADLGLLLSAWGACAP